MAMLISCSNSIIEPLPQTPPPLASTMAWEEALVEYLAQFPPMFYNVRFRDEPWGSWWESDWRYFVEELVAYWSDEWWQMENRGYSYTFIFRDPLTGERVAIGDVPYLNQRSGAWYDDYGMRHTWSRAEISVGFDLFDFEDTGIADLVIYWNISPQVTDPGMVVTLHRFYNGAFEFTSELSAWAGVEFYRADDGRLFIEYVSTVAHMIDLRLFHLDDEIAVEPALYTDGWTGTVYNRLTGEYFERDESFMRFVELDLDEYTREALLGALLGVSLTRIERMADLQEQLTELVSVRLRDDGLMR